VVAGEGSGAGEDLGDNWTQAEGRRRLDLSGMGMGTRLGLGVSDMSVASGDFL
jgi:hypothetical protein